MAALPGHTAIELYRTHGPLFDSVWKFYTRGLDPAWSCRKESRMDQKYLVGSRRIPASHTTRGRENNGRLKPEERRAVEALRTGTSGGMEL